jgi:hypothetical protein
MCISDYRRVLDRMIEFNAPYTFTTRDYRQYSAIADLHTLQFTAAHTLGFTVFLVVSSQRIYNSLSLQITHEAFFSQPNSFVSISP